MVEMSGPSNGFINLDGNTAGDPRRTSAFFCEAQTLGEALEKYCKEFGATARPYVTDTPVPPFAELMVYDDPQSRFRDTVVRISIERDGTWIAGYYGLDFPLQPEDKITFGVMAC